MKSKQCAFLIAMHELCEALALCFKTCPSISEILSYWFSCFRYCAATKPLYKGLDIKGEYFTREIGWIAAMDMKLSEHQSISCLDVKAMISSCMFLCWLLNLSDCSLFQGRVFCLNLMCGWLMEGQRCVKEERLYSRAYVQYHRYGAVAKWITRWKVMHVVIKDKLLLVAKIQT